MANKVHDLIQEQDALLSRRHNFVLSPEQWIAYGDTTINGWQLLRLHKSQHKNIPVKCGIYTLLVQPGLAKHPACSYLMYVGQAVNLKKRFGEYLNSERRASGRPKILRLLNLYDDYVWFAYTGVAKVRLNTVENRLIKAHLPPCNDKLPTAIRKAAKAF